MRKLLLLTFLMFTSVGFAQHGGRRGGMSQRQMDPNKVPKIGVVYGTVVDSASGSPISYASVAIINNRSNTIMTGGITNKDGEFHIKEIALGRHKVLIEYIGYKKVELGPYTFMPFGGNQTEYNLETISLTQTTLQMAGVDVEGERPLFIQTAEKRVFNVEKNSLSTGGNAIDALRQVPGVEVDPDDNISLRGSSRVNLMIDGKPSSIAGGDVKSLLQSIPSANIADIEVMTNPGAKYDPEGMANMKKLLPGINYCESLQKAVEGADGLVIMTEWHEFRAMDLKKVADLMSGNIIVDARNILDPKELKKNGFIFQNVGRPNVK